MDVPLEARPLLQTNQLKLCSTTQVEKLKLFLRLLPIWFSCLMYPVVLLQTSTFFTKQSSTIDRKILPSFILPPASLSIIITLAAMVFVPIYDCIFVPIARRLTGIPSGLTMLQRIGVGTYLSVIYMVIAALKTRRLGIVRELGLDDLPNAVVPMSMWWLLPQYLICGVSNVFAMVGLQEIFYDQMPDGMRSIGCAVFLSIVCIGSFLSSAIISVVEWTGLKWLTDNLNHAHLDYYYWILVVLSLLSLGFYMDVAKCFVYKKTHDILP
ncbi:LOW QUALITY PROTEIN: protein NRT1/ PTR FAMILY 5.4-like protein [Cinnamomum micranthum f. kanehirae]|uniref:Protein NRT1/ PTR FAMILY 5.4-like protein n=1 Tax=Cinnamomum micranthum f. kanehirae TaxID=337451 RepID=A0A3S3N4M6_9MAGN|nr:LOW QUALITY PROTEIN: protein NRT1/ PTR FAMILY 5.4-like protein [Cinnamomum micranthum f. kanehirae]